MMLQFEVYQLNTVTFKRSVAKMENVREMLSLKESADKCGKCF